MTEPVLGSSLLQARDVHSSHHKHNHIRSHHNHERFHKRQDQSSETVVQVVQTVSVIQLIDASGATVGTTTQTSEPSTTQYYAVAATFGIESEPDVTTSSITDDVSDTVVSSVSPETASSIGTEVSTDIAASTTTSMTSSFPTVESFAQITSTPSDSSTSFPTFAGVTNSTTAAPTTSLFSNDTFSIQAVDHSNLTTSTLPYSSGTVLYNDTFTTTISASSSFTSSFASFTGIATSTGSEDGGSVTGTAFGGSGGSDSTATGDSSSAATSTSTGNSGSGSSSSTTPAGTVAGSVLGAVAGVGLILIAALMLLRYKKRQRGLRLSDGNSLPGTRGLVLGGGGGGGGSGGGAAGAPSDGSRGNAMGEMSERRSIPFAVPAALANLTGYKRFSQRTTTSSEGTEKGFQKVSGRKLPSVLQHGGDGYSDPTNPRDTISTEHSFYRDSTGFFGGPNMPRLAVGSPMRPESGIPVFHPGPARVAVAESGYFGSNLEPPPSRDALGRSLPSRDGSNYSRGSGSRFTEEI